MEALAPHIKRTQTLDHAGMKFSPGTKFSPARNRN